MRSCLSLAFALLAGSVAAFAQTGSPDLIVAYALRSNNNLVPLTNNGSLTFAPTPVASVAIADVVISNQGTGSGTVRSVSLSGRDFQLTSVPLLPAAVDPGESVRFSLQYSPAQLGSSTGQLNISFGSGSLSAVVEGSTSPATFSLSYIDPTTNNVVAVAAGGTVAFPSTNVGVNSSYVIIVRNQGPGTGFVSSISIAGLSFQLTDVPQLPVSVESGRDVRFGVRFTPQDRQPQTGTLRLDLAGSSLQVNLAGSGTAPDLSYEVRTPDGDYVPVSPSSELSISSALNETALRTFRVTNRGNADFQLTAITVSGTGFQVMNAPFLPLTLKPNQAQFFDLTFTPTQPGVSRGRLRVGNDSFDLVGNAVGSKLTFSYSNDAGTTPLTEGNAVIVPPTRVGESFRVNFTIQNTGTSATPLSTISIVAGDPVFSLDALPSLPTALNAGAQLRFGIVFTPNNTGAVNGSIRIDNIIFALSASGRQPVALPDYQIVGPTGIQDPLQQPAYGIRLASPYSLPIRGVLTLGFVSEVFVSNPAVQFATGGRTVNFTIPANTDRAIFDNGSMEVRLQTGTVAGVISLTPSFATNGGLDLTPTPATSTNVTVNRLAPRVIGADVTSRTLNSLQLLVSGYSTTRSLRQINVQIAPRNSEKFTNTNLVMNVESASLVWYQSEVSQGFGGLFSITLTLNLQRDDSDGGLDDLVRFIQSLGITATNEIGQSNSVSVNF